MPTVTNTDPVYGIDVSDGYLMQDVAGASVQSHSASQVVLYNDSTGDTITLHGSFSAFAASGEPTAGTISSIANGGTSVSGLSVDVGELFAAPTLENWQTFLSNALAGNDSVAADGAPDHNYIQTFSGDDTLDASASPQDNTLYAGAGDDVIYGGTGPNNVNGNKGEDTIIGKSTVGDQLFGGQGDDKIDASASNAHNYLNGNLGNDTLHGGSGGDTLRGGQGDDSIVGGAGADWLSGDIGHDTLTGGGGADTFHIQSNNTQTVITDFNYAEGDRVLLDHGETYSTSASGTDTLITLGGGANVILQGVNSSTLPAGSILIG